MKKGYVKFEDDLYFRFNRQCEAYRTGRISFMELRYWVEGATDALISINQGYGLDTTRWDEIYDDMLSTIVEIMPDI